MSTKERLEERKFIVECIKLYESLPALWNTKTKDYSNREKKAEQYQILLRKYRQQYPKADKIDLKKKFNSLRTNFRKELKKIRECTENVYEPTLWYFDQMQFLLNIEDQGSGREIEDVPDIVGRLEPKPKKKQCNSSTDELVRLITHRLKSMEDSSHQLGIVWGNKLSSMNRNQRIIAEKIITEVIFNGELGRLNFNTSLTNLISVRNLNSRSSLNKNATVANSSESSLELPPKNQFVAISVKRQRLAENILSYASTSPQLASAESTETESDNADQSFIAEEYDPLDNSVKLED